ASRGEPTEIGLWAYGPGGLEQVTHAPGVHHGWRAGGTTVVSQRSLAQDGATVRVMRDGSAGTPVASLAEHPSLPTPRPDIFAAGSRGIRPAPPPPSWH